MRPGRRTRRECKRETEIDASRRHQAFALAPIRQVVTGTLLARGGAAPGTPVHYEQTVRARAHRYTMSKQSRPRLAVLVEVAGARAGRGSGAYTRPLFGS